MGRRLGNAAAAAATNESKLIRLGDRVYEGAGKPHYQSWAGNANARYYLRLPGEPKAKGRTRATTFTKGLENYDGLIPWKGVAAMVGMVREHSLYSSMSRMVTRYVDPWYHSQEAKKECIALFERAADFGGANNRSQLGTDLHDMLELMAGLRPGDPEPFIAVPFREDIKAWKGALADAGVTPHPDWLEVSVYIAEYDVVGTFDMLAAWAAFPEALLIGDNKTERSTDYKGMAHATQLALYSLATHAIVWPVDREDTATLVELPPRRMDIGMIIHLPAMEGRCELHAVDLEMGRSALRVAQQVREMSNMRRRKDSTQFMFGWEDAGRFVSQPTEILVHDPQEDDDEIEISPEVVERAREVVAEIAEDEAAVARREELRNRANALPELLKRKLRKEWPAGLPQLKDAASLVKLDAIDDLIARFEREAAASEQRNVSNEMTQALTARLEALPASTLAVLDRWAAEAAAAGFSINVRSNRSEQAFAIVELLAVCAELFSADEPIVRGLVALEGVSFDTSDTTGALLASMTTEQARRIAERARLVADEESATLLAFDDVTGAPMLIGRDSQ